MTVIRYHMEGSIRTFVWLREHDLALHQIHSSIMLCIQGLALGRPRWASERLECQQTCFIMTPKTGPKKW